MTDLFAGLLAEIAESVPVRRVGRVVETRRGLAQVAGLVSAAIGDRVRIHSRDLATEGEVLRLTPGLCFVLPDASGDGMAIGDRVELVGRADIAPDNSWIGRIIDPAGQPLDGRPLLRGPAARALRAMAPAAATRRRLGQRLSTGIAVFDTLLPLVRGQRIGLFAGSGVGKSSLLARFARGVEADVVVIALVGERGRELREFTERVLGPAGMARSVVVTATSDQSPLMRRMCALTAMAVAFEARGLFVNGRGQWITDTEYWRLPEPQWHWSFQTPCGAREAGCDGPETDIAAFLAAVESLEAPLRAAWARCSHRMFDVAYDCGIRPRAVRHELSAGTLARLAAVNGTLRLTMYALDPSDIRPAEPGDATDGGA